MSTTVRESAGVELTMGNNTNEWDSDGYGYYRNAMQNAAGRAASRSPVGPDG